MTFGVLLTFITYICFYKVFKEMIWDCHEGAPGMLRIYCHASMCLGDILGYFCLFVLFLFLIT